jgi:inhibitor of KinA
MDSLQAMGDQAALAHFPDEQAALYWAAAARRTSPPGLLDVVQAYTSVAVYFDLDRTTLADIAARLPPPEAVNPLVGQAKPRVHSIACCYEMQLDLERVARRTGLTTGEVISLHTGTVYTVYAIGFCPGFPYLGYLPQQLCGVPRLEAPRLRVAAGSVGLTGRQTGIYTLDRPGGWNLIGRTPLCLVDIASGYFPLRTGDQVRFYAIAEDEYLRLQGQRLGGS